MAGETENPISTNDLSLAGRRILVLDDHEDYLFSLKTLFVTLKASVTVTSSGQQALDLLRTHDFDIILLDLQMPGTDGWSVVQQIRTIPNAAHLPTLAVTARVMPNEIAALQQAGFDDYVAKPVDVAELLERIQHLLSKTVASDRNIPL